MTSAPDNEERWRLDVGISRDQRVVIEIDVEGGAEPTQMFDGGSVEEAITWLGARLRKANRVQFVISMRRAAGRAPVLTTRPRVALYVIVSMIERELASSMGLF